MGRLAVDLSGHHFGLLVAVEQVPCPEGRRTRGAWWHCVCVCGGEKDVPAHKLKEGSVTSCGCLRGRPGEARSHGHHLHGRPTPTYNSWIAMKKRCYYERHPHFDRYGGRGIVVCDAWRDDFAAFLVDMGERPVNHTLDRIDNDGNYEPGNCRWATRQEQRRNRPTPHRYHKSR